MVDKDQSGHFVPILCPEHQKVKQKEVTRALAPPPSLTEIMADSHLTIIFPLDLDIL